MLLIFFTGFFVGVLVGGIAHHRWGTNRPMNQVDTDPVATQTKQLRTPFEKLSPIIPDDPRLATAQAAVQSRIETRLSRILAQAKADGRITNDGAEDLFCISDRTASTYLSELTKRGELVRKGAGRGTFYTPTKA